MPEKITIWKCNVCNKEFDNEQEAIAHEASCEGCCSEGTKQQSYDGYKNNSNYKFIGVIFEKKIKCIQCKKCNKYYHYYSEKRKNTSSYNRWDYDWETVYIRVPQALDTKEVEEYLKQSRIDEANKQKQKAAQELQAKKDRETRKGELIW